MCWTQIVGGLLLALPIIGVFIWIWNEDSLWTAVSLFGVLFAVLGIVAIGDFLAGLPCP